jgi:hypothetical protein
LRFLLAVFLCSWLVFLIQVNPAAAQVDQKASVTNVQGQTVDRPYVSFDTFEAVHLERGEDTVPLHELLMVSSADEITALFGTPDSTA